MISLIIFYIISALVLIGSAGVIFSRNIVYASFSLLLALLGTAGIFVLLLAEFLAIVQILIYGGAVVTVILFALMLTKIDDFRSLSNINYWPISAFLTLLALIVLIVGIYQTKIDTQNLGLVKFSKFSNDLFEYWVIPFEIASLVLLVALIGAIVILKDRGNDS